MAVKREWAQLWTLESSQPLSHSVPASDAPEGADCCASADAFGRKSARHALPLRSTVDSRASRRKAGWFLHRRVLCHPGDVPESKCHPKSDLENFDLAHSGARCINPIRICTSSDRFDNPVLRCYRLCPLAQGAFRLEMDQIGLPEDLPSGALSYETQELSVQTVKHRKRSMRLRCFRKPAWVTF